MIFAKSLLRAISKEGFYDPNSWPDKEAFFKEGFNSSLEFFKRLDNNVNFKGKTVLDVGCGLGSTCFYMALNGATKVVGIDTNNEDISFAKSKLAKFPALIDKLEFKSEKVINEKFDIVLSKDAFEHYFNPELFMLTLKSYLCKNGKMVIGFSPLWKSPYGAHLWRFTNFPWVHLLFPESILLEELRRFFIDKNARSIDSLKITGGLNRMTLGKYFQIVNDNNLNFDFIKFNVSSHPKEKILLQIFNMLNKLFPLREYFTVNLYSVLSLRSNN